METIRGTFIRSDDHSILIKTAYIIRCVGMAIDLIPYTPLIITGEYTSPAVFKIQSLSLDTDNKEDFIRLFQRRNFQKVGKVRAAQIYNQLVYTAEKYDVHDFSHLSYEQISESLGELKLIPETTERIAILISGLQHRCRLYDKMKDYGGTFADADALYQKYQGGAFDILLQTPYRGVDCGLSLKICDKIAKQAEFHPFDQGRLKAIAQILQKELEQAGSCCVTTDKCARLLEKIADTKTFNTISGYTLLLSLLEDKTIILQQNPQYGTLVYPHGLYSIEKQIVSELLRIDNHTEFTGFQQYSGSWAPDNDQLRAICLVRTTGVKIVTGGPGTGKTSVIHEIIREYQKHAGNLPVFLCAPTGAAAARITQALHGEYTAKTIHKLLDIRKFGQDDYHPMFNKKRQLAKGLYVVDEMSMVGEALFLQLLQAIPEGSVLILTGDVDQLQSVTSGTVLKDLITSKKFETVRLTQIHRQNGESTIVTNYRHVRDNDGFLETSEHFTIDYPGDQDLMMQKVAEYYQLYRGQCQILTLTRKGKLGKNNIDLLITSAKAVNSTQYKRTGYYLGDHIMMTVNDYDKGYYNGDAGVITQIRDHDVAVQFYEGSLNLIEDDLFKAEHAWSCTVHKAQGNEYDNVIIVADDEYSNMLFRSILLTAITRARKNVHLITTHNALSRCLASDNEELRVTGLAQILQEATNAKTTDSTNCRLYCEA